MIKRHVISAQIYDPGQDSKVNLIRVPDDHVYTIEKAYAVADRDMSPGTANYYSLQLLNNGASGTAATAVSDAIGGTPGWTGGVPKVFAITDGIGDIGAGEWLGVDYAETGTVASGVLSVFVEYVDGIGPNAYA